MVVGIRFTLEAIGFVSGVMIGMAVAITCVWILYTALCWLQRWVSSWNAAYRRCAAIIVCSVGVFALGTGVLNLLFLQDPMLCLAFIAGGGSMIWVANGIERAGA